MNIHCKSYGNGQLVVEIFFLDLDGQINEPCDWQCCQGKKIPEFLEKFLQRKSALTHQMIHSVSEIHRMFVVLSRSRKLRDSAFSLVAFSTCRETEAAEQWPLSFSVWNNAEVTGSYAG